MGRKNNKFKLDWRKPLIGFSTGFNYALYPVFFWLILHETGVSSNLSISFALVLAVVKELFTLIASVTGFGFFNVLNIFRKNVFTRHGILCLLAGVLSGPVGYLFYHLSAFNFSGSSIADGITTVLPIVINLIFEVLIWKVKMNRSKWIGMFLIFVSTILIAFFVYQSSLSNLKNMIVGVVFAICASFSWGISAFLLGIAIKKIRLIHTDLGNSGEIKIKNFFEKANSHSPSKIVLNVKIIASVVVGLVVMIPITSLCEGTFCETYEKMGQLFNNSNFMLLLWILTGIFLILAKSSYIKSIELQGPLISYIWYSSYSFIYAIIAVIINSINSDLLGKKEIAYLSSWWYWCCLFIYVFGVLLIYNDENKFSFKKKKINKTI